MKNLSSLLAIAILTTACAKESKNITYSTTAAPTPVAAPIQTSAPVQEDRLQAIRELLKSESPNLALAELLAKTVSYDMKDEVKELVSSLSPDEIESIVSEVRKTHLSVKDHYLYHGQIYQNHQEIVQNSLANEKNRKDHPFSMEKQLQLSAISYIKSKALNEIIETFDARAAVLGDDLAKNIAQEISQNDPDLARKIEEAFGKSSRDKIVSMISSSGPFIKTLDKYFRHSSLKEDEQYLVLASGILAGGVYTLVQENKGFKNIVSNVQEIAGKAKEFCVLVKALDSHLRETQQNLEDLSSGMLGARKDLSSLYDEARQGNPVESKKIMDFLYLNVISGEKTNSKGSNSSILSKQVSINGNVEKSLNAAHDLSQNLSNILRTTVAMGELLGVKPSKDLLKVMDRAQKVSAVVSTIQTGVMMYASGGVLGVVGALGTSPMMSMLGGGGQSTAQLSQINQKLNQVLENQKTMMKMQLETMNMIKDLALMVDMYHQREMAALAELRSYNLVEIEMQKTSLNKDIRSCERIINFQRSSIWNAYNHSQSSYFSIHGLKMVANQFLSSIQGLKGVRRIIKSEEGQAFESCQTGIAEVFGGNSANENPIRSIFMTNDEENLYQFQQEIYHPLLETLYSVTKTANLDSVPLHHPQVNFKNLSTKGLFLELAKTKDQNNDVYDMENLISVKGLERYLSALIILHPILELDRDTWNLSYKDIVKAYLDGSNFETNQNVRSYYFLNNALKLTQSAIAQEALLSGEPLLPHLFDKKVALMLSSEACSDVVCDLKKNKLLMKNFLAYALYRNVENLAAYKVAYDNSNKVAMANFFKGHVESSRINGNNELTVGKLNVKLPSPEELEKGQILYSENMSRLILMQDTIIEGIEKVVPVKRDLTGKDVLKLLLI